MGRVVGLRRPWMKCLRKAIQAHLEQRFQPQSFGGRSQDLQYAFQFAEQKARLAGSRDPLQFRQRHVRMHARPHNELQLRLLGRGR